MSLPLSQEIIELIPHLTRDELAELDLLAFPTITNFASYVDDPVGFGEDVFGETYTDDIAAVMESVRDYPVTIAESANAVGKTHGSARVVSWWYHTRKSIPGAYAQVYTAAAPPIENLRDLMWGQIYALTHFYPHVFARESVRADLRISYLDDPRSFITGVAIPKVGTDKEREAAFSGKHAPYLLFALDEGDAVPEPVYLGIDSCISGGKGRLLVMYNPRSDRGYVKKLKDMGANVVRLSAFNHPNVYTGVDIYPGAVTRNKTVDRIHQWTLPANLAEHVVGYGRFRVPDFLEGVIATDERNGQPYDPLPGGERVITVPEFSYMVLGVFPGVSHGSIYDVWLDNWDDYYTACKRKDLNSVAVLDAIELGTHLDARSIPLSRLPKVPEITDMLRGNVTPFADYIPGGGSIYWSIDDGYVGAIDPATLSFTADSHPRVIGFYQVRANGDLVRFDELYEVQEPMPERQIARALDRGYPPPEYVTIGPGAASLGGVLLEMGIYKNSVMVSVEESIKHLRKLVAQDDKGHRRFLVHPRCKHFRHEMSQYRRDERNRIIKAFDHGPDEARYLAWHGRNGF